MGTEKELNIYHRNVTTVANHEVKKRRRSTMASFKCNMGKKCKFEVKDEDEEELMQIITIHAGKTHNMKRPLPTDIIEKINRQIKKAIQGW